MSKCFECGDTNSDNFYRGKSPSLKCHCKSCIRKRRKERYYKTRKETIEYTRNWQKRNPEKHRENSKRAMRKHQQKLKRICIAHYSNETNNCACCGDNNMEFLTIDHINGGGSKHRKQIKGHFYEWLIKNNYPEGYRVLCMNCNHSLGIYGYCPHNKNYVV